MDAKKWFLLIGSYIFISCSHSDAAVSGAPKISASPSSVNFSPINLGSTSTATPITMKNTGTADLVVNSITITGTNESEFSQTNNCSTIQPGSSCVVNMTITPITSYGKKTATLNISTNDPKKATLLLKLSGQAPPPTISTSPSSLNLGKLPVGASPVLKSVVIKNNGISDLDITAINISGIDANDFSEENNCGTVPKGSSCSVDVSFAPTALNFKSTASLDISSNDPKKPVISLKLAGQSLGMFISGVAATGAPFDGATLTVYDKTGTVKYLQKNAVAVDGAYSITLPAKAMPPFIVVASRGDETLVSVKPDVTESTLNITQVTNLIASRLSSNGDPQQLTKDVAVNPDSINTTAVNAKKDEVQALIQPLTDALNSTDIDPLTGTFTTDGTGYDKVLNSLVISVAPAGSVANISVAVKSDDTNAIDFQSNSVLPPLTVDSSVLPPDGIDAKINSLLQKMTSCYALPTSQRTNGPTIQADACLAIFYHNDPTTYLSGGQRVGVNRAFSDLFSDAGTGTIFNQGVYEFTRDNPNKDVVISYKSTTASGAVTFNTFAVRDDNGSFKLIGNQYQYPGAVYPYQQLREFPAEPSANYYSTGYDLRVTNLVDGNGIFIFSKVIVTSPKGHIYTLKPGSGDNNLELVNAQNQQAATSFLRLSAAYTDANTTQTKSYPDAYEHNLFFVSQGTFTDQSIASIPDQSVWKFEYYLTGNSTDTPDATQTYRTLRRPATIAELQVTPLTKITQSLYTSLSSHIVNTPRIGVPLPTTGAVDISWDTPWGALHPTNLKIWGTYTTGKFNDVANVLTTVNSGSITCSKQDTNDQHCNGSNFANGDIANGLHLQMNESTGRQFAHYYALYKLW